MSKNGLMEDNEYRYEYYESGQIKRKSPQKGIKGLDTGYYENGNMEFTVEFDGEHFNGKWLYYFDNGLLRQKAIYKNGKLNGCVTEYYKSGNIFRKYKYKNDEINGTYTKFYNNGQIKSIISYKKGQKQGKSVGYYKNGNMKFIRYYQNDLIHGIEIKYYKNNKIFKTQYKYGYIKKNLKKTIYYDSNHNKPISVIFSDAYCNKSVEIKYDKKILKVPFVANKTIEKQDTDNILKTARYRHKYIHNNHALLNKLLEIDANEPIPYELYDEVAAALAFAYNSNLR